MKQRTCVSVKDTAFRREAGEPMSATVYVILMLVVIGVCTLVSVPALFFAKCPGCGVRNFIEARACKACNAPLPDSGAQDKAACGRFDGGS